MSDSADLLIATLLDPNASISERDDAAMDLGSHDSALDILLRVAANSDENKTVQESCGGAIAEIWKRHGRYDEDVVSNLAPSAQSEIRAAFGR